MISKIYFMKSILKFLFVFLFTFSGLNAQTDFWTYLVYFGGCPVNHIPKGINIPDKDKMSCDIINYCISGLSYSELKNKFPDSLDIKLSDLSNGKVIIKSGEYYKMTFPVITGDKRRLLKDTIRFKVSPLLPKVNSMISRLNTVLGKNKDLAFHFLWSRIIDDC